MEADQIKVTSAGLPDPDSLFALTQHAVAHGHLFPWTFVQARWTQHPLSPPERIIALGESGNSAYEFLWDVSKRPVAVRLLTSLQEGYSRKITSSVGTRDPKHEACLDRVAEILSLPTPKEIRGLMHLLWCSRGAAYAGITVEAGRYGSVTEAHIRPWNAPSSLLYPWTRVGLQSLLLKADALNEERVDREMMLKRYGEVDRFSRRKFLDRLYPLYAKLEGAMP